MNHPSRFPVRLCVAAFALLGLLVMAGCGSSDVGPSNQKVLADLTARTDAMFQKMLTMADFRIDDRAVVSEDRIKFHVYALYRLDKQRAKAAKRSARLIGYHNDRLDTAKKVDGNPQKVTLLYRRTGEHLWKLKRIQPGYQ